MKLVTLFVAFAALGPAQDPKPRPVVVVNPEVDVRELKDQIKIEIENNVRSGIEKSITAGLNGNLDLAFSPKFNFAFQPRIEYRGRGGSAYQRGLRALDRRQWDEAEKYFTEAAAAGGDRVDGSLYWKAYALGKLGRAADANAALDELAKSHPQSGWLNDSKALRAELAQAAGKPMSPEDAADDEIKLMAINSLLQTDPERSIPLLEKLLQTKSSPQLRERALFVLSQSNSPKAREAVVRVAKGSLNPDLQLVALRNLGHFGGAENRQLLADVYGSTNDYAIKKQILQGFMASGERERMISIAKSESNVDLRKEAIRYLGAMGASTELATMYATEQSIDVRGEILNGMMAANNMAKILEVARTEKDQKLRERAINMLGSNRNPSNQQALVELYGSTQEVDTKKRILRALSSQRNPQPIIDLARKETNIELKRTAVEILSHMKSKEATEFLVELLNK
ncbi:MAG TPA: HEAT repeat domain-containing protein [Bryobacteraceae bacterium]|nr:HEAT repeat domain-containing protein [Bryobacteraceae bacterium]